MYVFSCPTGTDILHLLSTNWFVIPLYGHNWANCSLVILLLASGIQGPNHRIAHSISLLYECNVRCATLMRGSVFGIDTRNLISN